MNRGLSDKLIVAFTDVVPVIIPLVENPQGLDPNRLAGFTSGEGCFLLRITKATTKLGFSVQLVLEIVQHARDKQLLISMMKYLDCGSIIIYKNACFYRVTKFADVTEKIIPFFQKYKIHGGKSQYFDDWCEVAEMMKLKLHLTKEGLYEIRKIKAGMNTGIK